MLDLDDLTREFFSLVPFTSMGRNAFSTSGGSRLLSFLAEKVEFKEIVIRIFFSVYNKTTEENLSFPKPTLET
jgi:hypothetical protein